LIRHPGRWSIFIDVEGFGPLYLKDPTHALISLGVLLDGVFKVGNVLRSSHRVFAHQIGDGVILVADIPGPKPDGPIAIAIALMRHMLAAGVLGKAAVSLGDFADVRGCYPPSIRDNMDARGAIRIGDGLMTIFTVMGSALIAAYKLSAKRSGACLLVDGEAYSELPEYVKAGVGSLAIVDWVHSAIPAASQVAKEAGLTMVTNDRAEEMLRSYLRTHRAGLRSDWIKNTLDGVNCESGDAL
jgi:hypothetical protein